MADGTTNADAVIIEHDGQQSVVVEVPPVGEPVAETPEAAVEIAQIEADASVEIAQTHAAVEIAAIEARAETDAEVAAMRERNTWLEATLTSTQERVRELETQLTPPPSLEEAAEELAETAATLEPTTVTSETTPETSSSTETEAPSESVEESREEVVEAVAAKAKRKLRLL